MTDLEEIQLRLSCLCEAIKLKQIFKPSFTEYDGIDIIDIAKKIEQFVFNK